MKLNFKFAASVLMFQALFITLVALNVNVAKQVLGFFFLLFVPGFILLRMLKIKNLHSTETVLFSFGLSISFLMIFGLVVNEVLPLIGVLQPLSFFTIGFNSIVFILSLFSFSNNNAKQNVTRSVFTIRNLILAILPTLSIVGSFLSAYYGNSSLLLLMIGLMAVIISLAACRKVFSSESYPMILFASAFAVVFMSYFYATNVMGIWDNAFEFYTFRMTQLSFHWNSSFLPSVGLQVWKTNSMLSVNILPTVISDTLGLDGVFVFKILYPFILSLVPVVVYELYITQARKEVSFVAAAFFIANCVGLGWGNDMQKVATLFYVLLLLIIFKDGISESKRNILFAVFTLSLVVSHYSMAYVFAFTLLLTWIIPKFIKEASFKISSSHVMFAFVSTFSWYVYVSRGATFEAILESARYVNDNLSRNFYNVQARGTQVTQFLGVSDVGGNTVFHEMSRIVFQISTALIMLGFLGVLLRRSRTKFTREFHIMIWLNLLIVLLNLVLPGLSATFLMQRFYETTLILLSPLFVVGCFFIFDVLGMMWKKIQSEKLVHLLMISVLILLLFFQSGFVYEITGVKSWSLALSGYRIDKITLYDGFGLGNAFDVSGAIWVGAQMNGRNETIYCDEYSMDGLLLSYGLIDNRLMVLLYNTTCTFQSGSFVFLRWVNSVDGVVESPPLVWNISSAANALSSEDLVYCNGGSIVYKTP